MTFKPETMKILLTINLVLLLVLPVSAQIPLGQWREHYSFNDISRLELIGDKVYCACRTGLFTYDTGSGEIAKLTKLNDLSDYDIKAFKYYKEKNVLFIGYVNGNIDLLIGNTVHNIPDIRRKSMIGSKQINNVAFRGDFAYLACDFGIVVVNLVKFEIADTYYIGDGGGQIKINDIAFDGKFFYAASVAGVYKAEASSPFLADYSNWKKITNLPDPDGNYSSLGTLNGKVLAAIESGISGQNYVYELAEPAKQVSAAYIHNTFLRNDPYYFYSFSSYYVIVMDKDANQYKTFPIGGHDAISDGKGNFYLATYNDGLAVCTPDGIVKNVSPNGPKYVNVIDIDIQNNQLWAASGGPSTPWERKGAYSFSNETWTSYNKTNFPELSPIQNISEVAVNPYNSNLAYGGSYGYGLVEFKDGKVSKIYGKEDGLKNIEPYTDEFIRLEDLTFDDKQNLWITSSGVASPVYKLTKEGKIENLKFKSSDLDMKTLRKIMVTENGQKWVIIKENGLFIFDDKGNERRIEIRDKNGNLITTEVYCMAQDHEGEVWLGTDKGIVVYRSTENAFTATNFYGTQIIKSGQYLFSTEAVKNIAIDGANRKWIGTESGGVYLMSADGLDEVLKFNKDNSPLYSNQITTIAIDQKTGEVFFGTMMGIISYKSDATVSNDYFSDVYVYPNPIRETYHGNIVITGLVEQTMVKITDVAGNIVFETTSLGGQAIWDGKNFDGKRVRTGVYLVYCSSSDASQTEVTKLLFIN
jgi:hypothetical protein